MTTPNGSQDLGIAEGVRVVFDGAKHDARELGDGSVGGEHVLASLFRRSDRAAAALTALGMSPTDTAEALLQARGKAAKAAAVAVGAEDAPTDELPLTSQARRLLEAAARLAAQRSREVDDGHLLLGAATELRGPFVRIIEQAGKTPFDLRREAVRVVDGDAAADALVPPAPKQKPQPPAPAPVAPIESAAPVMPDVDTPVAAEIVAAAPVAAVTPPVVREPRPPKAPKPPKQERQQQPAQTSPKPQQATARKDSAQVVLRNDDDDDEPRRREPSVGKLQPPKRAPLWRYVLLAAVPASIALNAMHADPVWVFAACCLAVLPVASYMGEATEHLAERTGPTIGGLLNATFGNAAELIIAAAALRAGYVDLVKASLIGSILGNALLILGLSIIAGGANRTVVRFNRTGTNTSASMLALAVIGMMFPALFHATHPANLPQEMSLSEIVAVILIAIYACSLLFTLKTHSRLLASEPHQSSGAAWSVRKAVGVLAVATVVIAVESELLVKATEAVTTTLGMSELFLGLIIVPIIGNAAEHSTAIVVARKGQVDLALQIALGSSTQIALLVAPVLVFLGFALGHPMNLVFSNFELLAAGVSVAVVSLLTLDGETHWFEGVQLLAVFGMIAAAAYLM